jgi:hypothetical protein
LSKIDAVARAKVNPKFPDFLSQRSRISQIAIANPLKPFNNLGFAFKVKGEIPTTRKKEFCHQVSDTAEYLWVVLP